VVHSEIRPDSGVVRTRTTLTSCSRIGAMTITAFKIVCHVGDRLVFDGEAVFGHFPAEALANQAGLAASDEERHWLVETAPASIDLDSFQQPPLIGREKLRMIDRISGYWPDGGSAGLGRIRAEKDIDPRQWFFKAHFFTDPVQPGSLGLEAVIQTLQAYMLERRCDTGFRLPRFEPVANNARISWTYRGQVVPHNKKVTILLEVTELNRDTTGAFAKATASLWVDGMKIYALPEVGMRIVEGAEGVEDAEVIEIIDPQYDTWLRDHCPTYTVPVLPMMSVVDRLASAAQRKTPGRKVLELRNVQLNGWIAFPSGPRRLKTQADEKGRDQLAVTLSVWRDAPHAAMSRYDVLAHAEVRLGDVYPPAPALMPPLQGAELVHDPPARSVYEEGELFHGPGFRFLTRLWRSKDGASFQLDSRQGEVPPGFLNQAILDGIAHGIPNENLRLWSDRVAADQVGYPSRVMRLSLFAETPVDGRSDCEVRFAGFHQDEDRFPQFTVQLVRDGNVWAEMDLVYALFSKGPLGVVSGVKRRRFLEQKICVPGLVLGRQEADATHVSAADIAGSDWLPGTVDAAFGLRLPDRVRELAVKQHVARSMDVHPASVRVADDFQSAVCSHHPLTPFFLKSVRNGETVTVGFDELRAAMPRIDGGIIRRFWAEYFGFGEWPIADLYVGLVQRFARRVELSDPAGFDALRGKPVIYLANHQVAIESIVFWIVASALSQVPIRVLAKMEHRTSPIGQLIGIARRYPGVNRPDPILYFDRSDPGSMLGLFNEFRRAQSEGPTSLMVHVEGTRSTSCRTPVSKVSSVLLDLALQLQVPVVPVRFIGGLPVEPAAERLEFPFGFGRQDIRFGSPLFPDTLKAMTLAERSRAVVQAINALAPEEEQPLPGEAMASWHVFAECLRLVQDRCGQTERLLAVIDGKRKPEGTWEEEMAVWLT
jgi:3-hydroxymyristoyl/3-hydroxydecanoyl-(acyl carrier protein) dehydratase/1-acyl-sn-glycerol-3-phosphate acyltransferase